MQIQVCLNIPIATQRRGAEMEHIRENDAPAEPVIEWQSWLDNELLDTLGNRDAYTFEAIWEDKELRFLACRYMLEVGREKEMKKTPRLHDFNREFATCGETIGQQARSLLKGNVSNNDALDIAIWSPEWARDTWPEMVRYKADQLRAAVLAKAPEWDFVKEAYDDDCEREEMKKRCPCRFNGGCVGC